MGHVRCCYRRRWHRLGQRIGRMTYDGQPDSHYYDGDSIERIYIDRVRCAGCTFRIPGLCVGGREGEEFRASEVAAVEFDGGAWRGPFSLDSFHRYIDVRWRAMNEPVAIPTVSRDHVREGRAATAARPG